MNTHEASDAWTDRLSEYLDGELALGERAALESHLASCAACRDDLDALRAVVRRAADVRHVPPSADLWPGILTRIGSGAAAASARGPRRFAFTLPQLVAAGLALMVLSGATVWMTRLGGPQTELPPVSAGSGESTSADALNGLERALNLAWERLDPQIARGLNTNLRALDAARDDCEKALAHEPDNAYLATCLARVTARKLEVLRHATGLAETFPN